ncbi:MAG: hypothetical protein JWO31_189 [Phycisphaerales bacterium]|nr:hypothetical protein [Phycisphaerales bacterium]
MASLGQHQPTRRTFTWIREAALAAAVAATAVVGWTGGAPARAQSAGVNANKPAADAKPVTDGKASDGKPADAKMDAGPENYDPTHKRARITPAELGRLRMLEIQSGAFREAHKDPGSQQLVGPPLSDREKVMHVMNRLAFGPKQGDVEAVLLEGGMTDQWKGWVAKQLKPESIDDAAVDAEVAKKFPDLKKSTADLYKAYPYRQNGGKGEWREPGHILQDSVLTRAVHSNRQLQEVLAEFWRNHFCVDTGTQEQKTRSWAALAYEQEVIRPNVMGKFPNMVFASARHPAMLDYLDNQVSKVNNWNENYARELMELHTVGVDRGYTDFDVIELSKVLTGWQFERGTYAFKFNDTIHQPGAKKVMGVAMKPGYEGGEQAIMMLATHKYTANFIATKLCKYFVNDAPPAALVTKVENVFLQTKGDLPKVYEAIFYSPEFLERGNFRAKFKTPFEFVVSADRAVDADLAAARKSNQILAKMGQEVYNCPDPTGYFDRSEAWLDSGVLTSRWDYALSLARGGVDGVKPSEKVFAKHAGKKVDELYKDVVRELICDDIGDKTRQVLKEAADAGDVKRMYAVLIGCPSFQQQ